MEYYLALVGGGEGADCPKHNVQFLDRLYGELYRGNGWSGVI